jgi:hypothetical protein
MAYATDLCGSKLKAKLASTLNEASAAPMSSTSFAAKQMAKMGWTEGTGLGKKRDGIVSHIKVQKREDSLGLGVEKERTRKIESEGMWWSANVSETLMRLQQKKGKKKDEKKSKKKKSKKTSKKETQDLEIKVYTDEELFAATGGARFGMRAQRRAEAKWMRTESSQSLREWEEEVKQKFEWNGLGQAQVLLRSSSSCTTGNDKGVEKNCDTKKRKRRHDDSFEEEKKEENCSSNRIDAEHGQEDVLADKKILKKKRKSEKKSSKKKSKERSE